MFIKTVLYKTHVACVYIVLMVSPDSLRLAWELREAYGLHVQSK